VLKTKLSFFFSAVRETWPLLLPSTTHDVSLALLKFPCTALLMEGTEPRGLTRQYLKPSYDNSSGRGDPISSRLRGKWRPFCFLASCRHRRSLQRITKVTIITNTINVTSQSADGTIQSPSFFKPVSDVSGQSPSWGILFFSGWRCWIQNSRVTDNMWEQTVGNICAWVEMRY
jgi:hypothetical protein